MAKDRNIELNIYDALIEKPYCFSVGEEGKDERHFYLFPVTLGKLHLLRRHLDNLHINTDNMKMNPHLEALRIVKENKEEVCRILAYHTLKKKRDIFDYELVESRTAYFKENVDDEDLASVLILILSKDDVEGFMKYLGITKEQERLKTLVDAKKSAEKGTNDMSFGCKTIYGTLIDVACERYGWTLDYVVWGISFVNLHLLLADRIQHIYITDDEKKRIPKSLLTTGDTINADDTRNMEKILSMDWR